MPLSVPSDIEIASSVKPRPIIDVARDLGLTRGRYRAVRQVQGEAAARDRGAAGARPAGAGHGDQPDAGRRREEHGLGRPGAGAAPAERQRVLCMREPSLGPVFGVKGGAAGGGYSQVIPMADINLHFTGDFHAISSAHALLSAMLDNHLQQGNPLNIDTRRITWPRTIDMNDRALRHAVIGLGGAANGVVREERWVIIPASEIMAIVALATSREDLEHRLGQIIVGSSHGSKRRRCARRRSEGRRRDGDAAQGRDRAESGADARGRTRHSSMPVRSATSRTAATASSRRAPALALGDVVVTEAGFGSDLGAEKFFDIKCRVGGLNPEAAVLVATVRSLKMQGGADKSALGVGDLAALERGLPHLEHHIENVRQFGVPVVVAINRVPGGHRGGARRWSRDLRREARRPGRAQRGVGEGWRGRRSARARGARRCSRDGPREYAPLYDVTQPVRDKIETIVRQVYGGDGVDYSPAAARAIDYLESIGPAPHAGLHGEDAVLAHRRPVAPGQADRLPDHGQRGVRLRGRRLRRRARRGDIMTMPGLPKVPAAEGMAVKAGRRNRGTVLNP